jgi:hypothetical protein
MWWIVIVVVLVLVVAGWMVGLFVADRRRSQDIATERERLDVDPQGPTSIPRDQQEDREP